MKDGLTHQCRICGCYDGEPGFCHALTTNGLACYRVAPHADWCSGCATWDKKLRADWPGAPIEALACLYRADRAEEAAGRRFNFNGAFALRTHAARLRRKSLKFMIDAGFAPPAQPTPPKVRDLPLCP